LKGSGRTGSAEGRCEGCNAPTGSGPALTAVVAVVAVVAVACGAFQVRRGADASGSGAWAWAEQQPQPQQDPP